MSDVFTSAGATLSIGAAAPSTYDKTGYEAVTWEPVGNVSDIPQFGKLFNLVSFNPLGQRGTVKRKGSYNNGSTDIQYGYVKADAGQVDVVTAMASDDPLPFRVVLQDTTHVYFMAMVMGTPTAVGTIDNIVLQNAPLEIDSVSEILFEVAPA